MKKAVKTKTRRNVKPSPKPSAERFKLVFEGQEMRVTYKPNSMGGSWPTGQFEFHSPYKPARRIPVSETGYRCHLAPMDEVETEASPKAYAQRFVIDMMQHSTGKGRPVDDRQPTFFGLLSP